MDLQAVIFDYGEVLSGPPDPQAHHNLLTIAGVQEEAFEKAYWAHRLDYDADVLNGQTYWQTIARDTGAHFTAEQIGQLMEQDAIMWMNLNPAMLAWIPRIKQAGFRLGILSNMGDGVLDYMRPRFPGYPNSTTLLGPVSWAWSNPTPPYTCIRSRSWESPLTRPYSSITFRRTSRVRRR